MRDHLKVLGWLYAASGALAVLLGIGLAMLFGAAGIVTGDADGGMVIGGFGFLLAMFVAALGLPSVICGWALLNYRPWSRTLGIVLSALQLASFPFGTALGGYGLWVLLNDESRRLLEAGDPRFQQVGAGW